MSCSLEFIYTAAMKTPDVRTPSGGTAHYDPAPAGLHAGECWLCGCATRHGHPRRRVIKPTFTDSNAAAVPWSDVVCEHCAWALSYKTLRNYSILATRAGLQHPSRVEIREVLLDPPEPPFVLCVAQSGQRWLHLRARVTSARDAVQVRFEDLALTVRPDAFGALLAAVEELYAVFGKSEIDSGGYQSHRIRQFGLERWERAERAVAPHRGSGVFRLALFVAQREGKEDERCTTDSTPTTSTLL